MIYLCMLFLGKDLSLGVLHLEAISPVPVTEIECYLSIVQSPPAVSACSSHHFKSGIRVKHKSCTFTQEHVALSEAPTAVLHKPPSVELAAGQGSKPAIDPEQTLPLSRTASGSIMANPGVTAYSG